ncbi:MAG: hypothetical protein ACI8ZF_000121 [Candidatus Midichloriaceae bacterium]|jgi:hypothetical protein
MIILDLSNILIIFVLCSIGYLNMTNKQHNDAFEKSVKPFYHKSDECYIYYSPSQILSPELEYVPLTVKEVKAKFGFVLLCDDLSKSVKEAESFRSEHEKMPIAFPLKFTETGKIHYGTETNPKDLLVLHTISPKIGLGISSYSALKERSIIAEYVGERKPMGTKILDTSYIILNNDGTKIDAKEYGNVARFFHHCPQKHDNEGVMTANLEIVAWKVSVTLTKLFFMTTRDIKEFEPLCWDYIGGGDKFLFDQSGPELLDSETYLPIDIDEL